MKIQDEFTDLPISRQRKHQLRNPDKTKVLKDRFRARHRDKLNQKSREWREAHPDYMKNYMRKYKKPVEKGIDVSKDV